LKRAPLISNQGCPIRKERDSFACQKKTELGGRYLFCKYRYRSIYKVAGSLVRGETSFDVYDILVINLVSLDRNVKQRIFPTFGEWGDRGLRHFGLKPCLLHQNVGRNGKSKGVEIVTFKTPAFGVIRRNGK
jgi:hypothetical protein